MRILLGTDGSRCARAAAHFLSRWMDPGGSRVDLVTVVPKRPASQGPLRGDRLGSWERWRGRAARWQDAVEEPLLSRGYRTTRLVRTGEPAGILVEMSRRKGYDLVVLGARGREDESFFGIGSTALAALDRAPAPVLVVRERDFGYRARRFALSRQASLPVLLTTDGPPPSLRAMRSFCSLFRKVPLEAEIAPALEDPEGTPGMMARLGGAETELVVLECCAPPRGGGSEAPESATPLGDGALEIVRSAPCSVLRLRGPGQDASVEPWHRAVSRSPLA